MRSFSLRKRKSSILPPPEEPSKKVSFNIPDGLFDSVLSQPFEKWNAIETVVGEYLAEWSPTQRSFIIQNLVRFLELKIMMEDYSVNQSLFTPTKLVAQAWRALILETTLYKKVTFDIQKFHGRPRKMIHHSLRKNLDPEAAGVQIQRTQSVFTCYYEQTMPVSLEEIDVDESLADASALTDVLGVWAFRGTDCGSKEFEKQKSTVPEVIEKDVKSIPTASWFSLSRWMCFDMTMVKESLLFGDDNSIDDTVLLEEDGSSDGTPEKVKKVVPADSDRQKQMRSMVYEDEA